ncbi:MAG: Ni/Fe hydrogenase subunit alpha [Immundisolibacter sp.]|uniref:Ni/Fe hydrogenase subunit alpha n=1 Tax=Immundisolibacter sp. TaxID=1934948 RepID=UPI003EE0E84F
MSEGTRTIEVNYLARVEGEGALHLRIEQDRLVAAQLRIFEPPRFFEALLRGRDFREAPDITARICGICPVAYLMSACAAMEDLCGVEVSAPIADLRRLLYCGEWIESHVLHIFMLHLPDFMGYPDAVSIARDHPELVRMGLRLKKAGNAIVALLGGREIHPINVRLGGFYRAPKRADLLALRAELEWALGAAEQTVARVSALAFPDFERDYEFVALRHPEHYPMNTGRLVSSRGVDLPVTGYDDYLHEHHEVHSTALQSRTASGGVVHLGPLARYALNRDRLTPRARAAADAAGLGAQVCNPFRSIVVRAVEVVLAFEEALRLVDAYREFDPPALPVELRPGVGYGATEAPRGTLYHRYTVDQDGLITDAKIVAPTAVNQAVIEADLRHYLEPNLHLPDDTLRGVCETAIRNYDPCISCSAHFLKLDVERD